MSSGIGREPRRERAEGAETRWRVRVTVGGGRDDDDEEEEEEEEEGRGMVKFDKAHDACSDDGCRLFISLCL